MLMTACGGTSKQGASTGNELGNAEIPNPIVEYSSIAEARNAVGFEFETPSKLPEGYNQNSISVINNQIAQINYANGENTITYRTAKGSDDISGDYNTYTTEQVIKVDSLSVTVKGENDLINLAYWTSNNLCYSIDSSSGITTGQLSEMIKSISK